MFREAGNGFKRLVMVSRGWQCFKKLVMFQSREGGLAPAALESKIKLGQGTFRDHILLSHRRGQAHLPNSET